MNTNCNKLASRFESLKAKGLIDVKFYVRSPKEATSEQICQEVNNLYDAIDRGEFAEMTFKKRRP